MAVVGFFFALVGPDEAWKCNPVFIKQMANLYGELVLPESITKLLNCRLGYMEHACGAREDRSSKCVELHGALSRHLLFLEQRPTVTRFWLFARCVAALLSLNLLGIDHHAVLQSSG